MNYVFFGSAQFSVYVLDELEKAGLKPSLIVTTPDKPVGRGLVLTPTPVKEWGLKRNIPVLDPAKLDADFVKILVEKSTPATNGGLELDTFIVAAYGKIIPQTVLDIPKHKTLNIHPSLLPLYRGASPLQSAMLDDAKKTGVTIMRIDEQMDHGPIVAQKEITVEEWPVYEIFEETMAREGGKLLAQMLPDWVAGRIFEHPQNHAEATFTKKIKKEDAEINFQEDGYLNFRKIQAYHHWPTAFFFYPQPGGTEFRIKITGARWEKTPMGGQMIIEKIIPEGKPEMDVQDFDHLAADKYVPKKKN